MSATKVKYLLSVAADIGKALCIAARFGDVNMLTMFVNRGADLCFADGE